MRDMRGVNRMYQDLLKDLMADENVSVSAHSAGLISAASAANKAVRAASANALAQSREEPELRPREGEER